MSDRIRNAILRRIADGEYLPGQRLIELQIAEEFGTSQAPVREAFRELETLKVVEAKRYCGTRVREVPVRERQEAYQVRAVLEQLAAELAVPLAEEQIAELRELAQQIMKAAKRGDVAAYASKDLPFHHKIVELFGNRILLQSWDRLGFELQTRIHLSRNRAGITNNATAHFAIVDALERGDGKEAGLLLRSHVMPFSNDD